MIQRRLAQALLPVLLLSLGACASVARWENEPVKRTSSASKPRPAPVLRRSDGDEYTVRPGDTLYSIAFRNQIDYHDLANWNGIGSDYRIMPGRVLRLKPGADGYVARPAPAPVARPKLPPEKIASKPYEAPLSPAPAVSVPGPVVTVAPSESVASAPAGAISTGLEWFWPTTGTILKTYAPQAGFKGLDFGGNLGQPVFAAASGRVVYSGNALKGYGELIIIKHNENYLSAYSYNQRRNVKEGDVVTAGQPIGELGMGPENKPFLHFEIRERGQPMDPMRFLPKRETTPGAKLSGN